MTYRIFLVEDDRSIAEGLQHQLEQWNFEVRVVQNFRGVLGTLFCWTFRFPFTTATTGAGRYAVSPKFPSSFSLPHRTT